MIMIVSHDQEVHLRFVQELFAFFNKEGTAYAPVGLLAACYFNDVPIMPTYCEIAIEGDVFTYRSLMDKFVKIDVAKSWGLHLEFVEGHHVVVISFQSMQKPTVEPIRLRFFLYDEFGWGYTLVEPDSHKLYRIDATILIEDLLITSAKDDDILAAYAAFYMCLTRTDIDTNYLTTAFEAFYAEEYSVRHRGLCLRANDLLFNSVFWLEAQVKLTTSEIRDADTLLNYLRDLAKRVLLLGLDAAKKLGIDLDFRLGKSRPRIRKCTCEVMFDQLVASGSDGNNA